MANLIANAQSNSSETVELRSLSEAPIVTVVHKEPTIRKPESIEIMAEGKPVVTLRNLTVAQKLQRDKEISEEYKKHATLKPIDSMRAADLLPETLVITKHAPKLVKASQVKIQKKSPDTLMELFMAKTSKRPRNPKRKTK